MTLLINSARDYEQRGFSVIPLRPKGKEALSPWKQYQQKKPTPAQIKSWWEETPRANVGIVTGEVSGVIVIDCDSEEACKRFIRAYPEAERTLQSKTGNGKHFYFKWVSGIRNKAGSTALGLGIDVRSDGGYVVAPPSIHPSGSEYKWLKKTKIQPLPIALKNLLSTSPNHNNPTTLELSLEAGRIKEGMRNTQLFSLACAMRARGAEEEAIQAALDTLNKSQCDPPLPDDEVSGIVESSMHYKAAQPIENLTDAGNARRFAAQHGSHLRYCQKWKSWLVWDEIRWQKDHTNEVCRRAKDTMRNIYTEASSCNDGEMRTNLSKHAIKSEGAYQIKAMISLAQSESALVVTPNDLDTNHWLLNVQNGTINLQDGSFHPHRKEHLITKLAPVNYDPKATCPTWDKFLSRVMNNNERMIAFLQRATGYALTGDVSEQGLFFLHGIGANGKSTFLNTIQEMLGDYAKQAAPDLLVVKPNGSHPTELANLQGSRLVISVEIEEGKRMAEALVKQLTGGDTISARFMFGDFFNFRQTHKLFLAANHKPRIRGTDYAIWRRIWLVPFDVTIPDKERDKKLPEKLRQEMPGILTWAVKGCRDWQKNGLKIPEEVVAATETYRAESDVLAKFIEDCCVKGERERVKAQELYDSYSNWCDQNNERAKFNQRDFSGRLKERNYTSKRTNKGYEWQGIGLR